MHLNFHHLIAIRKANNCCLFQQFLDCRAIIKQYTNHCEPTKFSQKNSKIFHYSYSQCVMVSIVVISDAKNNEKSL